MSAQMSGALAGSGGLNVITRLLGLHAALAVQFVLDGLRAGLPGLAAG